MKKKIIALKNLAVLVLLTAAFIACDKDFATIESDIINDDNATHFDALSRDFNVIAYTKSLPPVQTNNLPVNLLGIYDDPIYGQTTASFVSQVRSSIIDPDFGEAVVLDSVILTIPYYSRAVAVADDGNVTYELDSVFGNEPVKLSIFENKYFLRDFNPNSDLNDPQIYYSNMSNGQNPISSSLLEGTELTVATNQDVDLDNFIPNNDQVILKNDQGEITARTAPALRLNFTNLDYWTQKVIEKSGQPELSNQNNFNDYFRGLYFKVESLMGSNGNMSILNFANTNANVTLYYTRDPSIAGNDRVQSTYTLNFTGNRVNFLSNDYDFQDGNETDGDEKLFLKGGEGSMAIVKLFDGENSDEDDTTENAFEAFKNEFIETDDTGKFVRFKKLVNEANLVFYVDQTIVDEEEPERIFLYDMENNVPLLDYFIDSGNNTSPLNSRISHLGRLQRESGQGVKYKVRITEHINNLLLRDSTNVALGLTVSGNINLESNSPQYDILTSSDAEEKVPVSSLITQRGTVLIGNNTLDEEKKLYLEIFFTEPNN